MVAVKTARACHAFQSFVLTLAQLFAIDESEQLSCCTSLSKHASHRPPLLLKFAANLRRKHAVVSASLLMCDSSFIHISDNITLLLTVHPRTQAVARCSAVPIIAIDARHRGSCRAVGEVNRRTGLDDATAWRRGCHC